MPEPTSEATTVYEIDFLDGTTERLDIPSSFKVTYGPVQGASQPVVDKQGGGKVSSSSPKYIHMLAFRAWETETKQRIMLTNVIAFRDVSIPRKVKAVRLVSEADSAWFVDDGRWTGHKAAEVEFGWAESDKVLPAPDVKAGPEKVDPWDEQSSVRTGGIIKRAR